MNRHTKLKTAINELLELELEEHHSFFQQKVLQMLLNIQHLMEFPQIVKEDFSRYLEYFKNDLRLDMEKVSCICETSSREEKELLLKSVKSHTKIKLQVVEYAFAFYLKDISKLYLQEDKTVPHPSGNSMKKTHIYDWIFHHGKSPDPLSKRAAAS